jgi:hypothetical protein
MRSGSITKCYILKCPAKIMHFKEIMTILLYQIVKAANINPVNSERELSCYRHIY